MRRSDPQVAIIGGGFMGLVHTRAARSAGGHVTGVASHSSSSAERAREHLDVPRAYPSVEDLLADDRVEVVHVCTPNSSHEVLAAKVLSAGKHVVCEKPLATSSAAAAALRDQASRAGLVAVVPFVYRFYPLVREALHLRGSGSLGEIGSIHGAYLQDWLACPEDDDWRVDPRLGGPSRAFADIGSHLCDLMEFVTLERIARLSARTRTVHRARPSQPNVLTEDLGAVVFETVSGVIGSLHVSQVAAGKKNALSLSVYGTRESLHFDQENPDVLLVGAPRGTTAVHRTADLSPDSARYCIVPPGHPQGYQDAFNALIADSYLSVRGDMPSGLPTFEDGHRAVILTEAVIESSRTRGWIEVGTR